MYAIATLEEAAADSVSPSDQGRGGDDGVQ